MSPPMGKPPHSDSEDAVSDKKLAAQARTGDATAFEQLFKRYHFRISLYLIRMIGNDAIGAELTQETFLKAWQSLPELQDTERFGGWLYQIATNLARDHQRRSRRISWLPWENFLTRSSSHEKSRAGPEKQVEENELLKAALAQVSLTYRACLVLYIVEDLPQKQIAEHLGIKASYVSNYVRRGLTELRSIYTRLAADQDFAERSKKE